MGLLAGAQITLVSSAIGFRFRITKVKLFFLDDCLPDLRYYVLVGSSPGGSTTGLPEGDSIFAPYSTTNIIRGSQGVRIMEPMIVVDSTHSYLKVHVHNADTVFPCNYAVEITIERL